MKNLISLAFLLLVTSCAVGPLNGHETARTVGNSRHEFVAGYGTASYVGKWTYGVTNNLDFGVQLEELSLGARLKLALINPRDAGFALALAGGVGTSVGGSFYNGDIIISTINGPIEPYAMFRYNSVRTDKQDFRDTDTGALNFVIDEETFSYGQIFIGTRIWLNRNWALSVEGSKLIELSNAEFSNVILVSGALVFRY